MAEPSAYILSKCLSQLIGRSVNFVQAKLVLDAKTKQVYGIYQLLPYESAIILKADLPLLASFAGALVGLPDQSVKDHLKVSPMEELLRDAISEVLNITAAAITTEGRAVFVKMVTDPASVDGEAGKVLSKPFQRSYFTVTVDGYQGGRLSILSPFIPVSLVPR